MNVDELFLQAVQARRPSEEPCHDTDNEYLCTKCVGTSNELVDGMYPAGTRIQNEDGLYVCVTCGRTDWAYISDEPEWNGGGNGEGPDMTRVGAPVNTDLYSAEWGSGTIMSTRGASFANKRLARINFHTSMNHKDRSLHHAYDDLDRVGRTTLNLPESVMLQAKIMYKKFNEEKLTRGAIRTGIKANCIFRACRDANVARTTQEIASAFGIPPRDISRTADMFRETIPERAGITRPSDLIARLFNDVTCVPPDERGRARQKVIQACRVHEMNVKLMGKTPKGVASAVMFVTLGQLGFPVDKEEIRRICDVSMPTLNKLEALLISSDV